MMNGSDAIILSALTTQSSNVFESIHDGGGGEHMSHIAYLLTATTLFLIGFFGFFLNLFVIILMCKDMQVSDNGRRGFKLLTHFHDKKEENVNFLFPRKLP